MGSHHLSVRKLVFIAVMTAVLEAAKWALNSIANVELVTLLLIVYTIYFGLSMTMICAFLFAGIECLWWGISIWTVTYFYVWPLLVLLAHMMRRQMDRFKAAVLSCIFGLVFGALCALVTLVMSGWSAAFAWWIAGIPYDLVHGVSNLIIAYLLYEPLMKALAHTGIAESF
ncbi:MAG TPA: hypothetical protein DHW39_09495 [Erysipelotrichaceae bacterium]|nr:hypothetical protein [Erysipelotrichaceae bacterium]